MRDDAVEAVKWWLSNPQNKRWLLRTVPMLAGA
jgi:hypothetical protein